ncbi:hypothetical protein HFD88_000912 [Aspergillus terreus]|nr:hypothetical protein HFD88_000912 [Aspergillus terreus]
MRTGVVVACLLSLVAAAPAENLSERDSGSMIVSVTEANGLQKRVEGGVYICTDINWGGNCGFAKQPWDQCIQLDSPWWHSISSIGPDEYNAIVAYEYVPTVYRVPASC